MAQDYLQSLSRIEMQEFILAHENEDERILVLQNKLIQGVPSALVANQISGRRKAKDKLPTWYRTSGVIYPPALNLEQCSSEATATSKASMAFSLIGPMPLHGVDLTCGFGVDSFFLSRFCKELDCVDQHEELLRLARHNHLLLGANNLQYHPIAAEKFLNSSSKQFDFALIDPSRRNRSQKVFRLAQCEPNVLGILPAIFAKARRLLIKASPLIDLHQGIVELGNVEKVFVVSVENECKEVLFWCNPEFVAEPSIVCVNLDMKIPPRRDDSFTFTFSEEKEIASDISEPLTYLYEPNASILKAGAFKLTGWRYGLRKIAANTHLFTSDQFVKHFPGRIFKIEYLNPGADQMRNKLSDGKANVLTRNYPLSPEQLKKKFKLKDGGENYLIGFSGSRKKHVAVATRLK